MSNPERAARQLDAFLRCHTAEEYFEILDVAYAPSVLAANRLPILRYFAHEIAEIDRPGGDRAHPGQEGPEQPPGLDPVVRLALYRAALRSAYQAFAAGRVPGGFMPIEEIVIAVPVAGGRP